MNEEKSLMEIAREENPTVYRLTIGIQMLLLVALVLFILRGDWTNVFLTSLVIALTVGPAFLLRKWRVYVPPEFQFIAVLFTFLTLFLGSARGFYEKFWWWDTLLHTGSGFLLGIVGFIVLFLLNHTNQLPEGVKPSFLCFFGVIFGVFVGVIWEVFEFAMDYAFGLNMQRTDIGSGVTDTMWDLIVDTAGATVVGFMAWAYIHTGKYGFLADAVERFLTKNPRLFEEQERVNEAEDKKE